MKRLPSILFTLALLCVIPMTTIAQESILKPHLYKKRYDNGLTLIVKEVPGSKAATVQIWVKAGSIYEEEREAGITHLIEHMIFKGTDTRGPGDLALAIEEKGGQINAYTSFEYTVYHATLSARHWSDALAVLTDAVLHSSFDPAELEREKLVVLEEIRMRNDRPPVRLYQKLMETAYAAHPYRLPVIGSEASVSSFTREDILRYIGKHYHPDTMAVVVVGDARFLEVERQVAESLAGRAKANLPVVELPQEPPQTAPRTFADKLPINQTHLAMAFPIPPFRDDDAPVIDIIAGILGHGESSRLYHQLRDLKGLVYKIGASAFTPKDPGLFEVIGVLDGANLDRAMTAALEEIFRLKYVPVDEAELERIKRNVESEFIFNLERVEGQARVLGSFEFIAGDPREDEYLAQVRAVTREDVLRVARKYFLPERLTAGFLAPQSLDATLTPERIAMLCETAEAEARAATPPSLVADAYLGDVHRFVLPNGIRLLVREDKSVPTVGIRAVFLGGLMGETLETSGAFAFLSDLLPKGTQTMNARALALEVADMAGELGGFTGKNTYGIKAGFLSRFLDRGLELVRDVLRTPAFAPEEAEKVRREKLDQLRQQEDSLPSVAFREFNRLLFRDHPYALNQAGTEEALQRLSPADLAAIHARFARPDGLVLTVAGDVNAQAVRERVEALFGDWAAPNTPPPSASPPPLGPLAAPVAYTIAKDKEQTHLVLGFPGATMHRPDRFALEVLETALSGQSGRLFRELRDRMSLAYSLSAFTLLGTDTGSFGIYIGTSPDKKEQAIAAAWAELNKLRDTPLLADELEKAKNVLIGHYELGLQTHGAQAMEMGLSEIYGLGQDFGARYVREIGTVSPEDVLAAARKYIVPEQAVLVAVGAGNGAQSTRP